MIKRNALIITFVISLLLLTTICFGLQKYDNSENISTTVSYENFTFVPDKQKEIYISEEYVKENEKNFYIIK